MKRSTVLGAVLLVANVTAPEGAASAMIGFRDDESFQSDCLNRGKCCSTGQQCRTQTISFDNEGARRPNRSTNGCTFTFVRTRRVCP